MSLIFCTMNKTPKRQYRGTYWSRSPGCWSTVRFQTTFIFLSLQYRGQAVQHINPLSCCQWTQGNNRERVPAPALGACTIRQTMCTAVSLFLSWDGVLMQQCRGSIAGDTPPHACTQVLFQAVNSPSDSILEWR